MPIADPRTTDSELVLAVLAGEAAAFAEIYDRYADRLYGFCVSMLRNGDDAADAVQDTFVLAAQRLAQLRAPDKLRAWLYAIARREALRRIEARTRVVPMPDTGADVAAPEQLPERAMNAEESARIVWEAAEGLSERDRVLLELHLRQGLDGQALADAIGVTPGHAYVLMNRLREQVDRSLGALLVARLGSDDCEPLRAVLAGWDGRFSPVWRKRVARHVDECDVCSENRRRFTSPWSMLAAGAIPAVKAPTALRERVLTLVSDTSTPTPPGAWSRPKARGGFPPALFPAERRGRRVAAAAAVAAIVAGGGGAILHFTRDEHRGSGALPIVGVPTAPTSLGGATTTGPLPSSTTVTTSAPSTTSVTVAPTLPVVTTSPPATLPPTTAPDSTGPTAAAAISRDCVDFNHSPQVFSASVTDPAGVQSVIAVVTVNNTTTDYPMAPTGGDAWSVSVTRTQLGFSPPNMKVTWTVRAVDGKGNTSTTLGPSFSVPTQCP